MATPKCSPAGFHLINVSLEDGTLCRGFSPVPGPCGYHLLSRGLEFRSDILNLTFPEFLQLLDDEKEFKVLTKKVHVLSSSGAPFKNLKDYLAHRDRYFGPARLYNAFAKESDQELLTSTHTYGKKKTVTLRSRLDSQFQRRSMDEAVRYFYRWVRKAYKKEYGDDTDVPRFIFRGSSDELDAALKGVKFKDAHYGGFNPRPIKGKRKGETGYRLGTLSDHASGMAIDVDPDSNPQISIQAWAFIEKFTGKSSTFQSRETQWKSDPGALWKYVNELSIAFATEYRKKEKALMDEEKKAPGPAAAATPAQAAASNEPDRFKRAILNQHYKELKDRTDGFFTLDQELVLALREHGLTWGATFGKSAAVDLMHFELRETPLPLWPPPPQPAK